MVHRAVSTDRQHITPPPEQSLPYDAIGQRHTEALRINGAAVRDLTYTYNNRGWLVGVDGNLDFAVGGSSLDQDVHEREKRFRARG